MKVKLEIEFEVEGTDEENVAKSAASMAAYDYLSFCTVMGVNAGRESVEINGIDGCPDETFIVRIGEDHE